MQGVRQDDHGRIAAPLWWTPSTLGHFTTKSAYDLLLQAIPHSEPFPWEIIWRFHGPSKGSLLLWHVTHDRLKTTSFLVDRQVMSDPSCLLCGAVLEDTLHAIRDCRLPRQVWRLLLPPHFASAFWASRDPRMWIRLNLQRDSTQPQATRHWKYIFRQGLQELWLWRNLQLYQQKEPPNG